MIGDFKLDDRDSHEKRLDEKRLSERRLDERRLDERRLDERRPDERRPDVATSAAAPAGVLAAAEADAPGDHAALVTAHEAATGWSPEHAVRLAALTSRIAKLQRQAPVTAGAVVVAFLVGLADLALAGFAVVSALGGNGDRADEGVLVLLAMFVPTVWAAWTLTRRLQGRQVRAYQAERDRLRRDRGCGDPGCAQCE